MNEGILWICKRVTSLATTLVPYPSRVGGPLSIQPLGGGVRERVEGQVAKARSGVPAAAFFSSEKRQAPLSGRWLQSQVVEVRIGSSFENGEFRDRRILTN